VQNIAVDAARNRIYAMAYASGTGYLFVMDEATPVILTRPVSTTVAPGGTVTLSVGAVGFQLSYQWAFNGTNIVGATNATLTLTGVSALNAGLYTVTVGNELGAVTSPAASVSLVGLGMFGGLIINGPVGATYNLQFSPAVGPPSWTTLTNVTLPVSPYIYIDYSSYTNSQRFYRAVPLFP
jgi:hypothetical protein